MLADSDDAVPGVVDFESVTVAILNRPPSGVGGSEISEIQGFGATTTRRVATTTLRLHEVGLRSWCASSRRCNGESNCCKTYHVTGGREKNDAALPPADVPSRNSTSALVDCFSGRVTSTRARCARGEGEVEPAMAALAVQ
jgi:hypothetical protein